MDNQGPNNYNNGNNNYNNNGGNNGGQWRWNNGGNGGRDNHNGQLIMAFVLVSLIVLFIMSMVSNRFSQMSTQEISLFGIFEKVEGQEKSNRVEIGSTRSISRRSQRIRVLITADLLLRTCGR